MELGRLTRLAQAKTLAIQKHSVALVFLFLAAFGVRMYGIDQPPLDFHATRQYRSLLIARGYYYAGLSTIPEWKKQVAALNKEKQGILEPPVMELLAAAGYRLFNGEHFWIPGLLSSLFWSVGGVYLYRIAKTILGDYEALYAVAFYLFLPFSIVASRSFQPDPLMVMLLLGSVHAMIRQAEQPNRRSLFWVYFLSAAAIFIKPVSLFAIFSVYVLLTLRRTGMRAALARLSVIAFVPLTLLPTLLFYAYGYFNTDIMKVQAQASFLPHLVFDVFFWRGWLHNIQAVVGMPALLLALLGLLMLRKGFSRLFMAGLWSGYALFCLVFSYHIATHDYYHLQLVPIVALNLAPLSGLIVERLREMYPRRYWLAAVGGLGLLAIAFSAYSVRSQLHNPSADLKVSAAREVGDEVNHSTGVVYLASDYGHSLEYHGELSGAAWPLLSDLEWERLAGSPVLPAQERFQEWFAPASPSYFIVYDLWEYEKQIDLQEFLTANYNLVTEGEGYLIYDLDNRPAEPEGDV